MSKILPAGLLEVLEICGQDRHRVDPFPNFDFPSCIKGVHVGGREVSDSRINSYGSLLLLAVLLEVGAAGERSQFADEL